MNWILASLLMFVSSVALYLCVRKSNELKVPQQLNNLAMFSVPVLVYLIMSTDGSTRFSLTFFEFIFIFVQSFFLSYLGNIFSLKGIEYSPNPGYSLIISKSYVVLTAVASLFLFQSSLSLTSVLAIFLIIGFSALIMVDPSKNKSESNRLWLPYTLGAFLCFGVLALSTKYLLNMGVPVLTRLIYSMGLVTIFILSEIKIKKLKIWNISKPQFFILSLIGLFGASFNYFMQVAFTLTPNVGYVNATNAASISLLTLVSAWVFKDELTTKKMIGVVGVTLGLLLLFL